MSGRKRILFLLLIMTAVSFILVGISVSFLYNTALEEEQDRLVETAQSQARLIEAVARFDALYSKDYPEGPVSATLSQIEDAHGHYKGFGKTGEFTLARLEQDNIVFLLNHRHLDLDHPKPVPFESDIAEPVRRALLGQSGTMVGLDYRGETVLAAYEPVRELNLGIVAKIDLAEVQTPFKRAVVRTLGVSVLVILGGAGLFYRISNPIIKRLEKHSSELRAANDKMKLEIDERIRAEDDLKWELSVNSSLSEMYKPLTSPLSSIEEIAKIILHRAKLLTGSGHGYVSSIDPLTGDNVAHTLTEMKKGQCTVTEKNSQIAFPRGENGLYHGLWGYALNTGEAFFTNAPDLHEKSIGVPEGHIPLDRFLSVPVMLGKELVGQIALANKGVEYTDRDLKAIRRFGEYYALSIQRKHAEEALQKAHVRLELRVEERTAELAETNRQLKKEIETRKRSEELLRKKDKGLSEAQRIAHLGNWDWNVLTQELSWSDEIYLIFGLRPQEFGATYDNFLASVHPEDRESVESEVSRALADPKVKYSIEHRVVRPDGSERAVHERGEFIFDDDGKPVRMIGTVQDITDRKGAEKALQESHSKIKRLKEQLEAESAYLREEIKLAHNFDNIIGKSDALKYVLFKVEQVASSDTSILILGETGTGKELVARALHSSSPRKDRPLIKVNCATLPSNLIESELFGHEKGAFTGAHARQVGRFEIADGATIFLDEVGELPLELQVKLLRVLQDGEFERLGNPRTFKVDARVIAATNRNLEEEVRTGRFRQDLWYRLKVFPITVPPLCDRKEDIPLLVEYFVNNSCKRLGKSIETISQGTMKALQDYPWPGNVRELEHVIERAVINSAGPKLRLSDKLEKPHIADLDKTPKKSLEEIERDYIIQILEETAWRIDGPKGAALILGLNPSTLRARMRKLGIRKSFT